MKYFLFYQKRSKNSYKYGQEYYERIAAVAVMKMTRKEYQEKGGIEDPQKRGKTVAKRNSPFGWLARACDGERRVSFNYFLDHISQSEYETYKEFGLIDATIVHSDKKGGPIFDCRVDAKQLEEILRYSRRPSLL